MLRQRLVEKLVNVQRYSFSTRRFHVSSTANAKPLPPRPVILEEDIEENFLKGSGPGGQKINKTSSAVQLKHIPTGIVVKSQHTRSRTQNRKYARQALAEKLDNLAKGDQSRSAIKAAAKSKKKASASKKTRRKYRALEAAKAAQDGENVLEEEEEYSEHEEKGFEADDSVGIQDSQTKKKD